MEEMFFGLSLTTLVQKVIGVLLIIGSIWFGRYQYIEHKKKSKMHRGRRTLRTDVAKFLKRDLRVEIKQRQENLSEEYCTQADKAIAEKLLSLPEYINASTVFCYVSTSKEINTYPILEAALNAKKRVCVPKCVEKGVMQLIEIKSLDDLEKGAYGIMEPKEGCERIYIKDVEFGVIPCVSCNCHGERLGHGGGYYDRVLYNAPWPSAVLCREKIMEENIPVTDYDVTIGIIISENNLWRV